MRIRLITVVRLVTLMIALACAAAACTSQSDAPRATQLKEVQRDTSGEIEVVLLAVNDALKEGKSQATLEFRTGDDHHLVDVGTVKVNASMAMPGFSPMLGSVFVNKSDVPGRYTLDTDLTMAGTWELEIAWDGPAGKGSVNIPGTVR